MTQGVEDDTKTLCDDSFDSVPDRDAFISHIRDKRNVQVARMLVTVTPKLIAGLIRFETSVVVPVDFQEPDRDTMAVFIDALNKKLAPKKLRVANVVYKRADHRERASWDGTARGGPQMTITMGWVNNGGAKGSF